MVKKKIKKIKGQKAKKIVKLIVKKPVKKKISKKVIKKSIKKVAKKTAKKKILKKAVKKEMFKEAVKKKILKKDIEKASDHKLKPVKSYGTKKSGTFSWLFGSSKKKSVKKDKKPVVVEPVPKKAVDEEIKNPEDKVDENVDKIVEFYDKKNKKSFKLKEKRAALKEKAKALMQLKTKKLSKLPKGAAKMFPTHKPLMKSKNFDSYVGTGIPGLDALFIDGIPEFTSILIEGGPGSGKTIFCLQAAMNACKQGKKVLYMSFEEPENRLVAHMKRFGWDAHKYISSGKLRIKRFSALDIARSVEALLS